MHIQKENLPLFKGIDLSIRKIPYLIAEADRPGPTICLTAAIHGDEVTGTAVIAEIFKRLEDSPLKKGKVFAFPILNPSGFEAISRQDLYAEADLNRNFPGDPQGSTAERHAHLIFSAIKNIKPDFVIDLHSDSLNSIVYSIIDNLKSKKAASTYTKSAFLAMQLGFPWVVVDEESADYPPEDCLTGSLIASGIPAVTIELGAPLIVMEKSKQQGVDAIWDLMAQNEMVAGKTKFLKQMIPHQVLTVTSRLYTQASGIVEYLVEAGETIEENKILGKVRNVFGETIEVVRSPVKGVLISHEDQSVTFPGKELFTIATSVSAKKVGL